MLHSVFDYSLCINILVVEEGNAVGISRTSIRNMLFECDGEVVITWVVTTGLEVVVIRSCRESYSLHCLQAGTRN